MNMPETNYEMTQADLDAILDACKPVPAMMIGGTLPRSQQENANDAWAALGRKMGFDHMTVRPIAGKGDRFFSAVPSETDMMKSERLAREAEAERTAKIQTLKREIAYKQAELAKMES
jgi:hypothetical protein